MAYDSDEKCLLYILLFSQKHPDCGQIKVMLSKLDNLIELRIRNFKKQTEVKDDGKQQKTNSIWHFELQQDEEAAPNIFKNLKAYPSKRNRIISGGSIRAMVAIATQIALENINSAHYALRLISRLIDIIDDKEEKNSLIVSVYEKLCNIPNSTYIKIWLQNLTYELDREQGNTSRYSNRLCKLVMNDTEKPLWNSSWLRLELTDGFPYQNIVNHDELKACTPVIKLKERSIYNEPDFSGIDLFADRLEEMLEQFE